MNDLRGRTAALNVAPWKPAVRALRRLFAIMAGVAVLAGATAHEVAAGSPAEVAPAALPVLRILEYGAGGKIFDNIIGDLIAAAGPMVQTEVTHGTTLAAFRSFCQSTSGRGPDILLTTRRIFPDVAYECTKNDATSLAEVELGRGAMVLAVRSGSELTQLTRRQVYQALARDVPYHDEFRRNIAIRWSDIDRTLPAQDIRFQLPPHEAGGRVMFDSLVMEAGCRTEQMVKLIFSAAHRTARCVTTRIDRVTTVMRGHAVEELLDAPVGTVGVLAYSDVARSGGALLALTLDGVAPSPKSILDDTYELSGSFWLYARRGQPGAPPAVDEAVTRIVGLAASDPMIGPDGILVKLGVLPLPANDRAAQRAALGGKAGSYVVGSLLGWIASAVSSAWNLTGIGVSYGELNPSTATLPDDDADKTIDLTKLMDIAGYKVKELQTKVGLIPEADMTFGQAREMSPGDLEYLERTLYRDWRRRPYLLSAIQRRIVRTIIDVASSEGYQVDHVDISMFPLPSVTLVVAPSKPVVGPQTTLLLEAIDRLHGRINEAEH